MHDAEHTEAMFAPCTPTEHEQSRNMSVGLRTVAPII